MMRHTCLRTQSARPDDSRPDDYCRHTHSSRACPASERRDGRENLRNRHAADGRLVSPARTMEMERPIEVAIVGGGCAGMAAAFELTRPEHKGKYRLTVYQLGWRLGGKGASGRGEADRIEEHGLHVWMGVYENAFRVMR